LLLHEAAAGRTFTRIVDCGAGTGRNLDWLSQLGPAVGVELTPAGLSVGRSRGRRMIRGTVAALPFADATVDLATSFDVLYCLDDRDEAAALREMWRVLRPGGLALVNVAALDILRGSHSTLTHEVRRYTRRRLRDRLERAGFRVLRLTFTNMTLFPPAFAVRTIERLTGRAAEASDADLGEAAFLRVANLPIGTSIMAVATKTKDETS
jgi:ubiquinone/menaquinone biosynthesis C-methylase UbiE